MENLDYAAFATRIIRAHGRRIAQGDIEALPDLLDLADELHAATRHAVNGLRAFGYSWADIAAPPRHHPPSRPTKVGTLTLLPRLKSA